MSENFTKRVDSLDDRLKGWMVVAERSDQNGKALEAAVELQQSRIQQLEVMVSQLESRYDSLKRTVRELAYGAEPEEFSAPIGGADVRLGGLFAVGDPRRGVVPPKDEIMTTKMEELLEASWKRGRDAALDEAESRVVARMRWIGVTRIDIQKQILEALRGSNSSE
jgi:hypothetical protein